VKGLARLVAVLAIVVFSTSPASADSGWTIRSFDADITIRGDGSLLIVEAIDVDFDGLEKHGIFRDIPFRYRYDDAHDRVYRLFVQRVTDADGRPVTFQVSNGYDLTQIKIGDPGRTVSGPQSYRIAYTVEGALNAFADHDELYWNVNGGDWGVPTLAASARLRWVSAVPGPIGQTACFQGPAGSTETCRATGTTFTATRPFAPGEELTIVASLTKGAFTVGPIIVDRPRPFADYSSMPPLALGAAAVLLVAGVFAVWWLWWTRGRDRGPARGAIVPEYEPPDKLRPAQLGVIVDETADPRDLVATIVDLAVRGYLTITENGKAWLFGHTDWTLDKRKPGDELLDYERKLFDGLFAKGDSVLLSSLKGTFAPTLKSAEGLLYKDAMARGWFVADPSRVRMAYAGLGCLTMGVGILLAFFLGQLLGWGPVGLAVVPAGLLLVVLSHAMPARTAAGAAVLERTLGFKRYMDTAETDRAAFAEKEGLFTAYLPYAVMFGSVDRWMRAFAGLDVTKAVSSWYVGTGQFQANVFASSFTSFAGTLASTGGSGFSGGSAGGGGGGGGGGSW